ncbi:stage II sporulation protein R [Niallia sp. 01092]|uniref:stage II sporulation protein R n=1 Tax=unclassified Niallia TaxID=2837522 RepID=UPI003FD2ECA9
MATIYLFVLIISTVLSLYIPKNEVTANDEVVIPSDAIRLRILANSDNEEDQALKRKVRDAVNKEITTWVSELTSKEEAKKLLQSKLPEIQQIAEKVVEEENKNQSVKVKFGKVDFPTKLYGQFLYPAGEYEAILITLGKGEGANWWCVLFPPLCFLDFSNGVAVSDGFDDKNGKKQEKKKEENKANVENENTKQEQAVKTENENKKQEQAVKTENENTKQEQAVKAENENKKQEQAVKVENENKKQEQAVKAENENKKQEQAVKTENENTKQEQAVKAENENKKQEQAVKTENDNKNKENKQKDKKEPVYVEETKEDKVEVKFFIVEVWDKLFG